MNERAFRLDFFVAIAALLISALTAGTLIYQTHVIGDQFAATIWPYLSVDTTFGPNGEKIELTNDGVGPALVRSAQLHVDGRPLRSWNEYVAELVGDPQLHEAFIRAGAAVRPGSRGPITMSSIGPSTTLRPGESDTLVQVTLPVNVPTQAFVNHTVVVDLCYCSLNGSCWTLHSTLGRISSDPQPAGHCTSDVAIQSTMHSVIAVKRPAPRSHP